MKPGKQMNVQRTINRINMKLFQVFFLISTLFINVLNSQTVRTDYVESELISEVEVKTSKPYGCSVKY